MKTHGLVILSIVGLFASVHCLGQDVQSPFGMPKQTQSGPVAPPPQAVSPLDTLEFNGIMRMGGVLSASVYDTKTQRNYWLVEGVATKEGLRLVRYKADNNVVVVSRGGVSKSIVLKKSKIEPLKIASNTPVRPSPALPAASVNRSEAVPESDQEVRDRMQKVAEEIRRRRAERRARIKENRKNQN